MRLRTFVRDAARCGIATFLLFTVGLLTLCDTARAQEVERFWRTDLNRDRHVDFADLLILIEAIDVPGREHIGDLDGDGATTTRDLALLLQRREVLDDEVLECPPQDCDVDPLRPGRPGDDDGIPHPCPGDHDCDGVPDAADCQSPSYEGDPCTCLQDDGATSLDGDDDCDGVLNRLDCDSPCYQPGDDPEAGCSCEDDDGDGIQNQDDPDSTCYLPRIESSAVSLYIPSAPEAGEPGGGPGALLLINDGDADVDGILDYADGFNLDGQIDGDDDSAGDTFLPMLLTVTAPDLEEGTIRFIYAASDPRAGTVDTSAGVHDYTPDPSGEIRLWLADGDTPRSGWPLQAGGDFLAPLHDYSVAALGISEAQRTVTLWIEGVNPSATVGGTILSAVFTPGPEAAPAGDCLGDHVALTCFGLGFLAIGPDRSLTPVDAPALSISAPVIAVEQLLFDNPRISPDETHLLADLVLQGAVDDALCDLIPGEDGVIPLLEVRLNGYPLLPEGAAEPLVIPLDITKLETEDLLHPYDYEGRFNIAIHGVRVVPGVNQVELVAVNPRGHTGFATGGADIGITPPPDDLIEVDATFDADPYFATTVILTVRRNGVTLGPMTLERSGDPGHFILAGIGGTRAYSELLLRHVSNPNPFALDDAVIELHIPDLTITGDTVLITETGPDTHTYTGARRIEDHERELFTGYEISLEAPLPVIASPVDAIQPFLMSVRGPSNWGDVELELLLGSHAWRAVRYGDHLLLASYETFELRPLVLLPGDSVAFGGEPFGDSFDEYGSSALLHGIGRGIADAGVSVVEGVVDIAEAVWHLAVNYNTVSITWRVIVHGRILTEEDDQAFWAAYDMAQRLAPVVWDLIRGEGTLIYDTLMGDVSSAAQLDRQYILALDIAAELLEALRDYVGDLSDYEIGRIGGRIIGEALILAAEALLTGGAAAVATKSILITRLINKLRTVSTLADLEGFIQKLDAVDDLTFRISRSGHCFIAGTLVWTASGAIPIEQVEPGVAAVAWDPHHHTATIHDVLSVVQTAPTELRSLVLQREDGRTTTLTCTPTHPIWITRTNDFTPAGELIVGDLVSLADGDTATITRIRPLRAPPGARFTTYNLDIADAQTYCAGEWGVLVHNQGDLCEAIARTFERVSQEAGLRGYPALERILDILNTNGHTRLGAHLREVLKAFSKEAYEDALQLPPAQRLQALPTVDSLLRLKGRHDILKGYDFHVHHIVPRYIGRALFRALRPDATADDWIAFETRMKHMPGALLYKKDHRGAEDGVSSAHNEIAQFLPPNGKILDARGLPPDEIIAALREAYRQWERDDLWQGAQLWLNAEFGDLLHIP